MRITNTKKRPDTVKEVIALCPGEFLKKATRWCNKKLIKGSKKHMYRLHP